MGARAPVFRRVLPVANLARPLVPRAGNAEATGHWPIEWTPAFRAAFRPLRPRLRPVPVRFRDGSGPGTVGRSRAGINPRPCVLRYQLDAKSKSSRVAGFPSGQVAK
jgi:hypothetical protein